MDALLFEKLVGIRRHLHQNPELSFTEFKTAAFVESQLAGLWIYTPTVPGGKNAQEMWGMVPVPEGGAALAYVFLAGIACFGAMVLRSRQRVSTARLS